MAKLLVRGPSKLLKGEISVCGSKNAALPAMASSLLFVDEPRGTEFKNLPDIEDVRRMWELLDGIREGNIDSEIAKKIRASILVVGPALARFGSVVFPHPGGCLIGARPIDVFLEGWKAMGAELSLCSSTSDIVHSIPFYKLRATNGLHGCDYAFRIPSVTGTEGLLMTAVLAEGNSVLRNCAMEPEIAALANFLNENGARIYGAGTHTIKVEGRGGKLLKFFAPYQNPPDRIEAGSLAILGGVLAERLVIRNFPSEELPSLLASLKKTGVNFKTENGDFIVERQKKLSAIDIKTKEYPGLATDLQAPFTVLATQADGASMIHETIFEGRLNYVEDLKRMGANIVLCDPHRAIVYGKTSLKGCRLEGPDLRAGLAFIIAALLAEGESQIGNVYQIDRGYERIDDRLRAIGADIRRIN